MNNFGAPGFSIKKQNNSGSDFGQKSQGDDSFNKLIFGIVKQLNFCEFAFFNQKIDKQKYDSELEDLMRRFQQMCERVENFNVDEFFNNY